MAEDRTPPTDVKLSELDVKRVLERAARIDAAHPVTLSDLTQAAREAGISEHALNQAVRELLEGGQPSLATDLEDSATARQASATSIWVRGAAFGFLLIMVLVLIAMFGRLVIDT